MRFFVTGGAGFIGSALVRLLVEKRHHVAVYDSFERGFREYLPEDGRVEVVAGDVRDRSHVARALALRRPDQVVHLAALHFIPDCIARPAETLSTNVDGTRNVVDAAAAQGVRGFIFASSAAVYAATGEPCVEATTPLGPGEIYGQSKVEGERLVRERFEGGQVDVSLLRIFNAVGPRETNPHVLPHVLESLQRSDVVTLGNTKARRDYVDTRDVAAAILGVAERSRGIETYNVGSGVAHSVQEIVELLAHKLGRPLSVSVDPGRLRPVDRPLLLADLTRLRTLTGYVPKVSLSHALDDLIRYYGLRVGPAPTELQRAFS